jgi:hypothetical protein
MELEGSLPHSQVPDTCLCPEPAQSAIAITIAIFRYRAVYNVPSIGLQWLYPYSTFKNPRTNQKNDFLSCNTILLGVRCVVVTRIFVYYCPCVPSLPTLQRRKDKGLTHSTAHIKLVTHSNYGPTTYTSLGSGTNIRIEITRSDGKRMALLKT